MLMVAIRVRFPEHYDFSCSFDIITQLLDVSAIRTKYSSDCAFLVKLM